MDNAFYRTEKGTLYLDDCKEFVEKYIEMPNARKANLIFTSPPFPLNRAKSYGNMTGDEYLKWFSGLAPLLFWA